MIELFEENLVRLKLLSKSHLSDGSGIEPNSRGDFRLTGFAVDLYEFILMAPKVEDESSAEKK